MELEQKNRYLYEDDFTDELKEQIFLLKSINHLTWLATRLNTSLDSWCISSKNQLYQFGFSHVSQILFFLLRFSGRVG